MKESILAHTLRQGIMTKVPDFLLFSVRNTKTIKQLDFSGLTTQGFE